MESVEGFVGIILMSVEAKRPASLYKYYAFNENSLKVLINSEVWVPTRKLLNDPLDCGIELSTEIDAPSFEKWRSAVIELGVKFDGRETSPTRDKDKALTAIKKVYKSLQDQTGVFCLTEDPCNPLMWSHYADGHTGFCIEFEFDYDHLGEIGAWITDVDYEEHPKMSYWDFFLQHSDEQLIKKVNLVGGLLSHKAEDWKYEKEWRVFAHLKDLKVGEDGRLLPLPGRIKTIIFGMQMGERNRLTIARLLKTTVSYTEIKRKTQSFELETREVAVQ